jgi:hypothetical protein
MKTRLPSISHQRCDVEIDVESLLSVRIQKWISTSNSKMCWILDRLDFSSRAQRLSSRNTDVRNIYTTIKKFYRILYRIFNNVAQTFYPFFRTAIQILNFLPRGGRGRGKSAGEARGIANPAIYYPQISRAAQLYYTSSPPPAGVTFCAPN